MFRIILAFFLLVAFTTEVSAQRGSGGPREGGPRGGGPRSGGPREGGGQRPPRPEPPQPEAEPPSESPQPETPPEVAAEQSEQQSPQPERPAGPPGGRRGNRPAGGEAAPGTGNAASGSGTVPQLAMPADRFVPLSVVDPLYSDTIVPGGVPYKVVQYTNRIMKKYDLNENGFLEREEWSKMPGKPQSIDMDGDFVLSLEELVRFIALYGKERTLHRPNPPQTPASANWNPNEVSVFKPLSAPPKPKAVPTEAETVPTEEIGENQNAGETDSEQAEESGEPSEKPKSTENEGDRAEVME